MGYTTQELQVPVNLRISNLQAIMSELQGSLSTLKFGTKGFRDVETVLSRIRNEMDKLQIQTSKPFINQRQFITAERSIDKIEDGLSQAQLTMSRIKFDDLELNPQQEAQLKEFNDQIKAIKDNIKNVKEITKQNFFNTDVGKAWLGIDPTAVSKSLQQITSSITTAFSKQTKAVDDAKAKLKEYEDAVSLKTKITNFVDSIKATKGTVNSTQSIFGDIYNEIFNAQGKFQTGGQTILAKWLSEQFQLDEATVNSLVQDTASKVIASLRNGQLQQLIASKLGTLQQSTTSAQGTALADELKEAQQLLQTLTPIYNAVKDSQLSAKTASKEFEDELARVNAELDKYKSSQAQAAGASDTFTGAIQRGKSRLQDFKTQLQDTEAKFLQLERTQRNFQSMRMVITNFMGFTQVLNLVKTGVRNAANHIKELDSVMNKIAIVTNLSNADLWKQIDSYSDMAQKYGVSIKGAYEVSQIYYQQGLQTNDVLTLTNETLKLSKISGLDYAQTTDYMTTALRGFKMEMSEASTVVDVYSNLAAHTAVTQEELAVAMSKTASSLESVGASFQESSAMISTMVAVTRESATNIGSAMKSIAARYGEMKNNPSAISDIEGEAIAYNKVDSALQSVGISLKNTDGQFRNFTDVIIELGEKWDTLESTQQRYIATQFAGNRQQSRFLALISNIDLLKANLQYAEDSEDVGDIQALKALDSIETKIEQVKVAYQEMYTTIGVEDIWKGALDGAKNFMNTLNGLPKLFNSVPIGAIAMIADVVKVIKDVGLMALSGISKIWAQMMPNTFGAEAGQKIGEEIANSLLASLSKARQALETAGQDAANSVYTGAGKAQKDLTQPAGKEQTDKAEVPATVQNISEETVQKTQTMAAAGTQFSNAVASASENLSKAAEEQERVATGLERAANAMESIGANAGAAAAAEGSGQFQAWLNTSFSGVDFSTASTQSIKEYINSLAEAPDEVKQEFNQLPADLQASLVQGLLASKGAVGEAAADLANTILQSLRTTLQMHSPSPMIIAMFENGVGDAIELGLHASIDTVESAAAKLGQTVSDELRESIEKSEKINLSDYFDTTVAKDLVEDIAYQTQTQLRNESSRYRKINLDAFMQGLPTSPDVENKVNELETQRKEISNLISRMQHIEYEKIPTDFLIAQHGFNSRYLKDMGEWGDLTGQSIAIRSAYDMPWKFSGSDTTMFFPWSVIDPRMGKVTDYNGDAYTPQIDEDVHSNEDIERNLAQQPWTLWEDSYRDLTEFLRDSSKLYSFEQMQATLSRILSQPFEGEHRYSASRDSVGIVKGLRDDVADELVKYITEGGFSKGYGSSWSLNARENGAPVEGGALLSRALYGTIDNMRQMDLGALGVSDDTLRQLLRTNFYNTFAESGKIDVGTKFEDSAADALVEKSLQYVKFLDDNPLYEFLEAKLQQRAKWSELSGMVAPQHVNARELQPAFDAGLDPRRVLLYSSHDMTRDSDASSLKNISQYMIQNIPGVAFGKNGPLVQGELGPVLDQNLLGYNLAGAHLLPNNIETIQQMAGQIADTDFGTVILNSLKASLSSIDMSSPEALYQVDSLTSFYADKVRQELPDFSSVGSGLIKQVMSGIAMSLSSSVQDALSSGTLEDNPLYQNFRSVVPNEAFTEARDMQIAQMKEASRREYLWNNYPEKLIDEELEDVIDEEMFALEPKDQDFVIDLPDEQFTAEADNFVTAIEDEEVKIDAALAHLGSLNLGEYLAAKTGADTLRTAFDNFGVADVAKEAIGQFDFSAEGDQLYDQLATFYQTVMKAADNNQGLFDKFYEVGLVGMGEAVTDGVFASVGDAEAAANALGKAVLAALQQAINAHSPSPTVIALFQNGIGEAIEIGLNASEAIVAKAAERLGLTVTDELQASLKKADKVNLSDYFEAGDAQRLLASITKVKDAALDMRYQKLVNENSAAIGAKDFDTSKVIEHKLDQISQLRDQIQDIQYRMQSIGHEKIPVDYLVGAHNFGANYLADMAYNWKGVVPSPSTAVKSKDDVPWMGFDNSTFFLARKYIDPRMGLTNLYNGDAYTPMIRAGMTNLDAIHTDFSKQPEIDKAHMPNPFVTYIRDAMRVFSLDQGMDQLKSATALRFGYDTYHDEPRRIIPSNNREVTGQMEDTMMQMLGYYLKKGDFIPGIKDISNGALKMNGAEMTIKDAFSEALYKTISMMRESAVDGSPLSATAQKSLLGLNLASTLQNKANLTVGTQFQDEDASGVLEQALAFAKFLQKYPGYDWLEAKPKGDVPFSDMMGLSLPMGSVEQKGLNKAFEFGLDPRRTFFYDPSQETGPLSRAAVQKYMIENIPGIAFNEQGPLVSGELQSFNAADMAAKLTGLDGIDAQVADQLASLADKVSQQGIGQVLMNSLQASLANVDYGSLDASTQIEDILRNFAVQFHHQTETFYGFEDSGITLAEMMTNALALSFNSNIQKLMQDNSGFADAIMNPLQENIGALKSESSLATLRSGLDTVFDKLYDWDTYSQVTDAAKAMMQSDEGLDFKGWMTDTLKNFDFTVPGTGGLLDSFLNTFAKDLPSLFNNLNLPYIGEDAAKQIVAGLAIGFSSNIQEAVAKATDAGQVVINALNQGLGVNSPSVYAIIAGKFVMLGLEEGLSEGEKSALQEMEKIGQALILTLNKEVEKTPDGLTALQEGFSHKMELLGDRLSDDAKAAMDKVKANLTLGDLQGQSLHDELYGFGFTKEQVQGLSLEDQLLTRDQGRAYIDRLRLNYDPREDIAYEQAREMMAARVQANANSLKNLKSGKWLTEIDKREDLAAMGSIPFTDILTPEMRAEGLAPAKIEAAAAAEEHLKEATVAATEAEKEQAAVAETTAEKMVAHKTRKAQAAKEATEAEKEEAIASTAQPERAPLSDAEFVRRAALALNPNQPGSAMQYARMQTTEPKLPVHTTTEPEMDVEKARELLGIYQQIQELRKAPDANVDGSETYAKLQELYESIGTNNALGDTSLQERINAIRDAIKELVPAAAEVGAEAGEELGKGVSDGAKATTEIPVPDTTPITNTLEEVVESAEEKAARLKASWANMDFSEDEEIMEAMMNGDYLYNGPNGSPSFNISPDTVAIPAAAPETTPTEIVPQAAIEQIQTIIDKLVELGVMSQEAGAKLKASLEGASPEELSGKLKELEGSLHAVGNAGETAGNKLSKINLGTIGSALRMLANISGISNTLKGAITAVGGAITLAGAAISIVDAKTKHMAATNPWMAIAMGVMALWNGLSMIIETPAEKLERLNKEAEELSNKAKEASSNLKSLETGKQQLEELEKKRYDSAEAAEEYQSKVESLAEAFPELVSGFDEAGEVIITTSQMEEVLADARERTAKATYDAAKAEQKAAAEAEKQARSTAASKVSKIATNLMNTTHGHNDYGAAGTLSTMVTDRDRSTLREMYQQVGYGDPFLDQEQEWTEKHFSETLPTLLYNAPYVGTGRISSATRDWVMSNYSIYSDKNKVTADSFIAFLEEQQEAGVALTSAEEALYKAYKSFQDFDSSTLTNIDASEIKDSDLVAPTQEMAEAIMSGNTDLARKKARELKVLQSKLNSQLKELEANADEYDDAEYEQRREELIKNNQYISDAMSAYSEYEAKANVTRMKNKQVATDYFNSEFSTFDFVSDKTGLTTLLGANYSELFQQLVAEAVKNGQTYSWEDFEADYGADMLEVGVAADTFWTDLLTYGDEKSQRFIKMMKSIEDYRIEDFSEFEGVEGWANIQAQLSESFARRIQQLRENLYNYSEQDSSENWKYWGEDQKQFFSHWRDATYQVQTAEESQFLKQIYENQQALRQAGDLKGAKSYGQQSLKLFNSIIDLPRDLRASVWDYVEQYGIDTEEGLTNIIEQIKANKDLNDDQKEELTGFFEDLKETIPKNLSLAVQAYTDSILESWSDQSKLLKKFTSGIDMSEAEGIIKQAEALGLTDFSIDSFVTDGDKLVLAEDAATKYWKAYFDKQDEMATGWENTFNESYAALMSDEGEVQVDFESFDSDMYKQFKNLGVPIEEYLTYNEQTGEYVWKEGKTWEDLIETTKEVAPATQEYIERLKKYNEWQRKYITNAMNWDAGDYSSVLADSGADIQALMAMKDSQISTNYANLPDVKNAVSKARDATQNLLNDLISKPLNEIDFDSYKGIPKEILAEAKLLTEDGVYSFFTKYINLLGLGVDETNDLLAQAIEKNNERTSADVIKDLQFLDRDTFSTDLTGLKELANLFDVPLETLLKYYDETMDKAVISIQALEQDGIDLTKVQNFKEQVQDSINTFFSDLAGSIKDALSGSISNVDAKKLQESAKQFGFTGTLDFSRTAEGLKLSEQSAYSLYYWLKQTDNLAASLVFDELNKSLIESNEHYKSMAANVARIGYLEEKVSIGRHKYQQQAGNVDLIAHARNQISSKRMQAAGWTEFPDEDYATLYTSTYSGEEYGANVVLNITPITNDGKEILSPDDLDAYVEDLMADGATADEIILRDTKHLVMGAWDVDVNNAEALADGIADAGDEAERLHEESAAISSNMDEWDEPNDARIKQYEEELALAKEIAAVRSTTEDSSFDFMNNSIPDAQNNPLTYAENWGKAWSTIKDSAESGYMDYKDFYNIMTEMGHLAEISGKPISLGAGEFISDAKTASDLITKGAGYLSVAADGSVQVDLSKFGVNFLTGADDMAANVDEGIAAVADAEIAMLDSMIQLLETIVAMDQLGDIDVEGNGIDFSDFFKVTGFDAEGNAIRDFNVFSDGYKKYRDYILTHIDKENYPEQFNEDLANGVNNTKIKVGDSSFIFGDLLKMEPAELAKHANDGLGEAYAAVIAAYKKAAESGDYDTSNIFQSIKDVLAGTGFEGEIEIGDMKLTFQYGVVLEEGKDGKYHVGDETFNKGQEKAAARATAINSLDTLKNAGKEIDGTTGEVTIKSNVVANADYDVDTQTYTINFVDEGYSATATSKAGADMAIATYAKLTGKDLDTGEGTKAPVTFTLHQEGKVDIEVTLENGQVTTKIVDSQEGDEDNTAEVVAAAQEVANEKAAAASEAASGVTATTTAGPMNINVGADTQFVVTATDGAFANGIPVEGLSLKPTGITIDSTAATVSFGEDFQGLTYPQALGLILQSLLLQLPEGVAPDISKLTVGENQIKIKDVISALLTGGLQINGTGVSATAGTITLADGTTIPLPDTAAVIATTTALLIEANAPTLKAGTITLGDSKLTLDSVTALVTTLLLQWAENATKTPNYSELGLADSIEGPDVTLVQKVNVEYAPGNINPNIPTGYYQEGSTVYFTYPEQQQQPQENVLPPDEVVTVPVELDTTDAEQQIDELGNNEVNINATVTTTGDTSSGAEDETATVTYTADTEGMTETANAAIEAVTAEPAVESIDGDASEAERTAKALQNWINTLRAAVTIAANDSATSVINSIKNALDELAKNSYKVKVQAEVNGKDVTPSASGNVGFAAGNAFAAGTLMGELGPELVVSNGRYFVVGQSGPEMVNLADDAIVFNHLQTKSLLEKGTSPSRGKAITNERNAVSYATGNVHGGPAMASASAALAALKQLRSMWQSLKNISVKDLAGAGGSGGGGGGGTDFKTYLKDLEKWYNWLQKIDQLEKDINMQEAERNKIASDFNPNGEAYYKSQMATLSSLKDQIQTYKDLAASQQEYFEKRRAYLNSTKNPFNSLYEFDKNGQLKYKEGALEKLSYMSGTDKYGNPNMSAAEQYDYIVNTLGIDATYLQYDASGNKIDTSEEGWEATAVQAFWDKMDADKEEMQSLHDSINDYNQKALELQQQQNEVLKEIEDNQIAVENRVLAAVEDTKQRAIDELQDQTDAIRESNEALITGLTNQLEKERTMYNNEQSASDLETKRRRLAILQRSGGSAAEIKSLQAEIDDAAKEEYFNKQQEQIDAIQEASDAQLEKLDREIDLMEEELEYAKEHGLLWKEVKEIMKGTPDEITTYITQHDSSYWGKSVTQLEQESRQIKFEAEQWAAFSKDGKSIAEILAEISVNTSPSSEGTSESSSGDSGSSGGSSTPSMPENTGSNDSGGGSGGSSGGSGGGGGGKWVDDGSPSGWKKDGTYHWKEQQQKNSKTGKTRTVKIDKGKHDMNKSDYRPGTSYQYCSVCGRLMKTINTNTGKVTKYDIGGIVEHDGPAYLHAKEAVLTAEQTKVLRENILSSKPNSLVSLLKSYNEGYGDISSNVESIETTSDNSITFEHAEVNVHVDKLANGYDAARAGDDIMKEMINIARKTKASNRIGG